MDATTWSESSEPKFWVTNDPLLETGPPQRPPLFAYRLCVCLVGLLGVVGNGLVFFIMVSNEKLRKLLTSTLIANQALVDMVCGLTLLLTYGYKSAPLRNYGIYGREVLCFLLHDELLLFCALNASTFCLVVVTLERYLMIAAPIFHRNYFTKKLAITLAFIAWLAGFLWNGIPTGVTTLVSKSGECILYNYSSYNVQTIFGYVYTVATFFAPMIMFAVAYCHMLIILRRKVRQVSNNANTKKDNMNKAQINLTKTMVFVTVGFAVCWTPNQIIYMLFNAGILTDYGGAGYTLTLFLAFMNCCINPFIYAAKYEGFRLALKGLVKHRDQDFQPPTSVGTVSTNRSGT